METRRKRIRGKKRKIIEMGWIRKKEKGGRRITREEAKEAFLYEVPIWHNGILYPYIAAIRYTKRNKAIVIQLELMDKNNNSIVIAAPKKVELAGDIPDQEGKKGEEKEGGIERALYECEGIKMEKVGINYVVLDVGGEIIRTTENKLVAWTSFSDVLDMRVRKKITEEITMRKIGDGKEGKT